MNIVIPTPSSKAYKTAHFPMPTSHAPDRLLKELHISNPAFRLVQTRRNYFYAATIRTPTFLFPQNIRSMKKGQYAHNNIAILVIVTPEKWSLSLGNSAPLIAKP